MKQEKNIEIDPDGEKTLNIISKAGRFNSWMYNTITPFCSGKVLEVGSGIGNISDFFLKNNFQISLSDFRSNYCEKLRKQFSSFNNLESVIQLDLIDKIFQDKYNALEGYFDTVFALNVIEHIENDSAAIMNCRQLLKCGGNLIILVPAYQALYNQFDVNLGHFRRYNIKTLSDLISKNGFEVIHLKYFNFPGILGWYISGKLLKKQTIPEGQMELYNLLVPVFKIMDKLIFNTWGLSAIAVGRAK